MNLKMEIFCQMEQEEKEKERNYKAKEYSRKVKREKENVKKALYVILGSIASLPVFYAMLFYVALV